MDGIMARLSTLLVDALFPPCCLLCAAPASRRDWLCAGCRSELPWLEEGCSLCAEPLPGRPGGICARCLLDPPPLAATVAALRYREPVRGLVHRYKYHARLEIARTLGALLAGRLGGSPRPEALLAVPPGPSRLRARGFDHALLLAEVVAAELGLPLLRSALIRVRPTPAQAALHSRRARRSNVQAAFAPRRVPRAHLALVDDVLTSGATARAAARALLAGGAHSVTLWVCARAARDPSRG